MKKGTQKLNHFFNCVLIKLNIYDWKMNLVSDSSEGYCWKNNKIIDIGLKNKNPKELILHEVTHIKTCRFCSQKHNPGFWKVFEDLMRKFLPTQGISKNMSTHKQFTSEGYYSLVYEKKES